MKMIGQNSPATPVPSTAAPSGVGSTPGVGEDRNERAERGRAQGDGEQPPLRVESRLLENDADHEPDRQRDRPADGPALERPPRNPLLDHLEAREEEQHAPDRSSTGR